MCLAKKVEKFKFIRPCLGGNPHRGTPIFVWFSLFLISTHSENLIHLALTVQKFKFLEVRIEEDSSNLAPRVPVTQNISLIFSIAQTLNAVRSAI